MCADCPDQSCPACQSASRTPRPTTSWPPRCSRPPQAARAARSQPSPSQLAQPAASPAGSRQGGRPVTIHRRTPDEPGTRRQADGPLVPAPRPGDKDLREMQDPYDLPFPDSRPLATRPSRVRDRRRPAPRLAARRASVPGRAPGNRTHPRTRARPGSRTMTPTRKTRHDPDHQRHHHDQRPDRPHRPAGTQRNGWEVSWLPGQILDRNTAITAMTLADTAAEQDLHEGTGSGRSSRAGPRTRPDRPDAIARASQPPGDTTASRSEPPAARPRGSRLNSTHSIETSRARRITKRQRAYFPRETPHDRCMRPITA